MNPKEILENVTKITDTNNRTILYMIDGTEIVGYFEGDASQSLITNNWRFVKTPKSDTTSFSIINGNDISNIEIINL